MIPRFTLASIAKYTPVFVVGFAGMTAFRSTGDMMVSSNGLAYGMLDASQWAELVTFIGSTASVPLLGTAMAAVGLKTSLLALQGVGPKPFILGLAGSTV